MLPSVASKDAIRYTKYLNNKHLGYICTPKKYGISAPIRDGKPYIIDNGVFSGFFEPKKFIFMLRNLSEFVETCKFVSAPDVVGNWRETLRRFPHWHKSISNLGFPVAVVLQDGASIDSIPWNLCEAVFVGGSTAWKMSGCVIEILEEAKQREKWRHIGRINSIRRMIHFWDYADSFDGSGFAFEPDEKLKLFLPTMKWRSNQCSMF